MPVGAATQSTSTALPRLGGSPPSPAQPARAPGVIGQGHTPGVVGPAGMPSVPTPAPAPTTTKLRFFDGLLIGLAASTLAGLAWWAITTVTEVAFWSLLSALVGVVIGLGVVLGTRRGGLVSALLALVLGFATVAVTVYFIDRSITIDLFAEAGRTVDVPLWEGFGNAKDVLANWIEYERAKAASWLLAPGAAFVVALLVRRNPRVA